MAPLPVYTTTLTQLHNALKAIYARITPNVNTSEYGLYTQAKPPYWTTVFQSGRLNLSGQGDGINPFTLTALCIYRAGYLTEATPIEAEAQRVLFASLLEFGQRRHLQSTAYPEGVEAIDAEGLLDINAAMVVRGKEPELLLTTETTLVIPLLYDFDEEDYH